MHAQQPNAPAKSRGSRQRRGIILLAVLVALVLLALAGYQYADMMQSEYRAADNAHRLLQARAIADSGIHYAAAIIASPDNVNNMLGGNISNNPQYFMDVEVPTGDASGQFGHFTLLAPPDPTSQSPTEAAYGLIDEGAKINVNVLMILDPSGATLYNALMMLPNMSSDIAYSIVDWLDADTTVSPGGAEDDYYMAQSPPYHAKNGALESIEELLLVKGVTPQLLFGNDVNRNGIIDENEANDGTGMGWSAFLTIYSREQNSDTSGNAYTYLNATDLQTLFQNLSTQVDPTLATFIVLYRQNGGSSTTGAAGSTGTGGMTAGSGKTSNATTGGNKGTTGNNSAKPTGDLNRAQLDFTKQGKTKIKSMWELVNATVTVPGSGNNQPAVTYASPLSDPSNQATMLPALFNTATLSQSNEIPARININTAPQEVLMALQAILNPSLVSANATSASGTTNSTSGTSATSGTGTTAGSGNNTMGTGPGLQDADVQTILSTRPSLTSGEAADPIFQTPAWLLLKANLSVTTLQQLDPYITTRSQVYRVQSIGYVGDNGPAVRLEAVIDVNGGRPRIVTWRDLTPLGKGWNKPQ